MYVARCQKTEDATISTFPTVKFKNIDDFEMKSSKKFFNDAWTSIGANPQVSLQMCHKIAHVDNIQEKHSTEE